MLIFWCVSRYVSRYNKNFDFKKITDHRKNFYERPRAFEFVDDMHLLRLYLKESTENKTRALMG